MAASEPSIPPLSTSIGTDEDEYYMQEALKVARSALDVGEVPVGCVIVLPTPQGPCIVSHGATQINTARDATRHAEIVAIDRMLASGSSSDQLKLLPTVFAKPARPESLSEASPLLTWKEDQDNSRFEQKSQDKWVNEPNDLDHWSNSYGWGSGRSFAVDILSQCTLYVTCEPCTMCAAALAQVGMGKVVFGCENDKFDGCGSLLHLHKDLAWTTADCMSQQSMPQWQSLRNRSESDGHVTSSLPPHTPHRRASRIRCESDGDVTPALPSFTTHRQSLRNRSESDGYVTPSSPSFLSPEESANGDDEGKNASKRLTKDQQPWRLKISGKKVVSLLMLSVVAVVVCDTLFAAPDKRLIQPDFSDVFLQWVQAHPTKGLAAIMIVIAGAVVFMVPIGTALALGCGYIYTGAYGWKLGLAIATAVSMGGSSLGAVTCFLVGRHLMRDPVRTWIKMYPLFVAIDIGTYCDWGERKAREDGWNWYSYSFCVFALANVF